MANFSSPTVESRSLSYSGPSTVLSWQAHNASQVQLMVYNPNTGATFYESGVLVGVSGQVTATNLPVDGTPARLQVWGYRSDIPGGEWDYYSIPMLYVSNLVGVAGSSYPDDPQSDVLAAATAAWLSSMGRPATSAQQSQMLLDMNHLRHEVLVDDYTAISRLGNKWFLALGGAG